MIPRGPFQPLPFCGSVTCNLLGFVWGCSEGNEGLSRVSWLLHPLPLFLPDQPLPGGPQPLTGGGRRQPVSVHALPPPSPPPLDPFSHSKPPGKAGFHWDVKVRLPKVKARVYNSQAPWEHWRLLARNKRGDVRAQPLLPPPRALPAPWQRCPSEIPGQRG